MFLTPQVSSWRRALPLLGSLWLACAALAQPAADEKTLPTLHDASATAMGGPWYLGAGWYRYSEPEMQLQGPMLQLRHTRRINATGWPDLLVADAALASLNYSSQGTGAMNHLPGLFGRVSALWRLPTDTTGHWFAGPTLDLDWTDLRGTSSSGHYGYRRQGTRIWAELQLTQNAWGNVQIGALWRGRQLSQLTDIPDYTGADLVNTQRQGWFAGWDYLFAEDSQLPGWQASARYTVISNSDKIGRQGWYEPRNATWQLSLRKPW